MPGQPASLCPGKREWTGTQQWAQCPNAATIPLWAALCTCPASNLSSTSLWISSVHHCNWMSFLFFVLIYPIFLFSSLLMNQHTCAVAPHEADPELQCVQHSLKTLGTPSAHSQLPLLPKRACPFSLLSLFFLSVSHPTNTHRHTPLCYSAGPRGCSSRSAESQITVWLQKWAGSAALLQVPAGAVFSIQQLRHDIPQSWFFFPPIMYIRWKCEQYFRNMCIDIVVFVMQIFF